MTYFTQEIAERNQNKIKVKRGKVFDYLGMDLDFESDPGTLIISMIKYLHEIIKEWPGELKGHKINPHLWPKRRNPPRGNWLSETAFW